MMWFFDDDSKVSWLAKPEFDIGKEIRQSKINSRLVAEPMGQMNRRPSV